MKFGKTGTEASPVRAPLIRDIVRPLDGIPDALYGFRTLDCGFTPDMIGDPAAKGWLNGKTTAGTDVAGSVPVLVSP
jgi:hypothetical protein